MDNIQDVDRIPRGSEESVRMTEDRDKWRKYVHSIDVKNVGKIIKNVKKRKKRYKNKKR